MPGGMFGAPRRNVLADLYFTPVRQNAREAHWRSKSHGSISAPKNTLGDLVYNALASGAKKAGANQRQANHLASRFTNALSDLTPVGDAVSAQQAGRDWRSGNTLGALVNGASAAIGSVPGLGDIGGHALHSIIAPLFHGSPHKFDKFSLSKIGTGEGAQAYGHGLYFAEEPAVAESYRFMNAPVGMGPQQNAMAQGALSLARAKGFSGNDAFRVARDELNRRAREAPTHQRQTVYDAMNNLEAMTKAPPGHLYEVKLNAEPEDFLDWDAPLSEQPDKVRNVFASNFDRQQALADYEHHGPEKAARLVDGLWSDPSGNNIYRNMPVAQHKPLMTQTSAERAALMREIGIPGIRYLDQGSRGTGNGTRNYVVFDDSIIDILNRR